MHLVTSWIPVAYTTAYVCILKKNFLKLEGAAYVQVCPIIPEHPVTLCNLRISVTISVTFNTD